MKSWLAETISDVEIPEAAVETRIAVGGPVVAEGSDNAHAHRARDDRRQKDHSCRRGIAEADAQCPGLRACQEHVEGRTQESEEREAGVRCDQGEAVRPHEGSDEDQRGREGKAKGPQESRKQKSEKEKNPEDSQEVLGDSERAREVVGLWRDGYELALGGRHGRPQPDERRTGQDRELRANATATRRNQEWRERVGIEPTNPGFSRASWF